MKGACLREDVRKGLSLVAQHVGLSYVCCFYITNLSRYSGPRLRLGRYRLAKPLCQQPGKKTRKQYYLAHEAYKTYRHRLTVAAETLVIMEAIPSRSDQKPLLLTVTRRDFRGFRYDG